MKKNLLSIAAMLFLIRMGFAETPALTIQKASKVCTPDGIANTDGSEPWTTTWINLTAEKTANTSHEITAHFQMTYNDTYLWIVAEQMGNSTIDTDHTALPNSWERDCIEMYIAMDTTSWLYNRWQYGEDDNHFRLQRAAEYPWSFDDAHSIGHNNADFLIGQIDAGDGSFVQEWQLPWAGLTAPMVDSGTFDKKYFKFEILAADNTTGTYGGRNDCIFWRNNSDNEYQDTRTFSLIMLGSTLIQKDSINFLSPDKFTTWTAGTTDTINFYFTLSLGSYNYSVYYKKAGGSNILLNSFNSGGYLSILWNIDFSEEGQYNIVLYDHNASKFYYSDTFTVAAAVPSLILISPQSGGTITSESKFYINWSAYNSGNIDVEISKNSGVSWDTIATNVTSNNSFSNSYQVTAPIFKTTITNGILKISNTSNTLYSQVINLTFSHNTPVLTIHKTSKVCIPDGIANTDGSEPWTTTWIPMTAEKTSNTVHEMTADFQITYNDDFLWIVAEQMGNSTIDTDHTAIVNSWDRDCIEVFLTMDTTSWKYNGVYTEATNQFRMQRASVYPWGFDSWPTNHHIGLNNANFTIGQYDAGDGSFAQEWQLPWAGLVAPMKDSGIFDGTYFKLEFLAADNTTGTYSGRNDVRFWRNNSDVEYQDTRTFSLIMMDTPLDTVTKDSINFISPVKSTIWTAGTAHTIYIYYKQISGNYDYSIYYRKVGGTNILINELYDAGPTSAIWNINSTEKGKYNIVLYDHYKSMSYYSDTFTLAPYTSIIKTSQVESLNVYPNPFNNNFKISFELLNHSSVEIGICDLLGKYVKTVYSGNLSKGKQLQDIDVSGLNSGAYILQLKTASGILKRMIVKK